MGAVNDGFRFMLELAALAAVGYWGFQASGTVVRWVLGLGAPLALAVVWAAFIAPRASHRLEDPVRLPVELAVFGAAVAALAAAGRSSLSGALAIAIGLHLLLTFPLGQR